MNKKVAPVPEGPKLGHSSSFVKGKWKPHVSVLADVARMIDPEEMKERVKTSWTTMGIVSALILTMTYPSIVSPPYGLPSQDFDEIREDTIMKTFSTLNVLSFTLALTIDIMIVILMTQLDLCCSPEHTRRFLVKFAVLNETLVGMFGTSIFILAAQVMVMTWYNFPLSVNIATITFWGIFVTFLAGMGAVVGMFNRFEVQERGKQLVELNETDANEVRPI